MREDKIANAAVEFVKIASWNNHQAVFVLRRAKSIKKLPELQLAAVDFVKAASWQQSPGGVCTT